MIDSDDNNKSDIIICPRNALYFQILPRSLMPSSDIPLWQSLTAEFIGTFLLIFISAISSALYVQDQITLLGSSMTKGLVLVTAIYIFSIYSGTHFNPVASLGFAAIGIVTFEVIIAYWIVQYIASILAPMLIVYF